MAQLNCRARLSLKTTSRSFVFYESLMQKLDRDRTVHREMTRAIHRAHTARAETFFDDILLVERAAHKRIRRGQCRLTVCHLMK